MKILVAAEDTGAIKAVTLDLNNYDKRPEIAYFAGGGRSSYIQKMITIERNQHKYIVVARKGGVVQMYDAETLRHVKEWKHESTRGAIVGLEYVNDRIITCTARGHVLVQDIETNKTCKTTISSPVSCFAMHKTQPGVAVAGGKAREIEIVQVFPELRTTRRAESNSNTQGRLPVHGGGVWLQRGGLGGRDFTISSDDDDDDDDDDENDNDEEEEDNDNDNENEEGVDEASFVSQQRRTQELLRRRLDSLQAATYGSRNRSAAVRHPYFDYTENNNAVGSGRVSLSERMLRPGGRNSAAAAADLLDDLDRTRDYYLGFRTSKSSLWRLWKADDCGNDVDEFGAAPVWVSGVRFLDVNRPANMGWKVAATTRFGEMLIYDSAESRSPVLKTQISDHPLVNLWFDGSDESALVFTNTQHHTGKFDCVTGTKYGQFKSASGGSMHVDIAQTDRYRLVACCGGVDGKLRIYDVTTGSLLALVPIGSRITAVALQDPTEDDDSTEARGLKREASSLTLGVSTKRVRLTD